MTYPTENLVRALLVPSTVTRETDDEDAPAVLFGEFARFNEWTMIDSVFEGRFMEQIAPTAFDRTLAEDLSRVKVLYDHGHDPQLGNKPLGPIRSVEATKSGMGYEVELIDTDYNRGFIEPAARAGLLGSSFRMRVRGDSWSDPEEASDTNPQALPERTITDVDLYEFGPVTFPAYEGATASMRSRSDDFMAWMLHDVEFVQRFAARTDPYVLGKVLEQCRNAGYTVSNGSDGPLNESATRGATDGQHDGHTPIVRSLHAARLELVKLRGELTNVGATTGGPGRTDRGT